MDVAELDDEPAVRRRALQFGVDRGRCVNHEVVPERIDRAVRTAGRREVAVRRRAVCRRRSGELDEAVRAHIDPVVALAVERERERQVDRLDARRPGHRGGDCRFVERCRLVPARVAERVATRRKREIQSRLVRDAEVERLRDDASRPRGRRACAVVAARDRRERVKAGRVGQDRAVSAACDPHRRIRNRLSCFVADMARHLERRRRVEEEIGAVLDAVRPREHRLAAGASPCGVGLPREVEVAAAAVERQARVAG